MKKYIEPTIHVIIWTASYFIFINGAQTLGIFNKVDGTIFFPLTIGTVLNVILFYSISLFLIPRFSRKRKIKNLVFEVILVYTLLSLIESSIDYSFYTTIYSSEVEPFGSQLILNFVSNILILSLALTYGFSKNWIRNERLKQKLKEEKLTAELNFLKAQINPHFLFNILNMAFSSASSKGDEKTANIIEKLSGLMRYMFYDSNSDRVDINKEINYIENYICLQKLRLSSEIPVNIGFNVFGDFSNLRIAPLILIPFVENAFKYGIKLEKKSDIRIQLEMENKRMNFSVENENFKINNPESKIDTGVGLKNVKKRLELLYPHKYSLIVSNKGSKFQVKLRIDLD